MQISAVLFEILKSESLQNVCGDTRIFFQIHLVHDFLNFALVVTYTSSKPILMSCKNKSFHVQENYSFFCF